MIFVSGLSTEFDLIQAFQLIDQHRIQQHARQLAATSRYGLIGRDVLPAELLQQLERRNLRDMVFFERRQLVVRLSHRLCSLPVFNRQTGDRQ